VIPFTKTEALGNDFILARRRDTGGQDYPVLARSICDRRLGVGADGLILWDEADERETFHVRIFNSDGSEAECSGNGLRCMAAYLLGRSGGDSAVRLETVSGIYTVGRAGDLYVADMGIPELVPEKIPALFPGSPERIVDHRLDVAGKTVRVTCAATGNPHCSLFVDAIVDSTVNALGPAIERHGFFPNGTNVEFIRVLSRRDVEVAFWERGAGRTPASGTGSCGAAIACVLNDRTERKVTVHTENGNLIVEWADNGRLNLTATATVVAEGRYLLACKLS